LPVKGLSVVAGASLMSVQSTTGFAPGALPDYDLFTGTLGLNYRL
jgi:hypothetical protein